MRRFIIVTMTGFIISPISQADLWAWKGNFEELPFYTEIDERTVITGCSGDICEEGALFKKIYLRANLVSDKLELAKIFGTWSGGDCKSDTWRLQRDGKFASKFPLEGEIYSWSGNYSLANGIYIEEGKNNKGDREYNEANLYYVPAKDVIIYKGLRGLNGYDENGNEKFVEYSGPEFYYFRRCESLTGG